MSDTIYPQTLIYTDADFRAQFPYFTDPTIWPEALLYMYFTMATAYVQSYNWGALSGANRQLALYCMTAHLAILGVNVVSNMGGPQGVQTEARIDKIQVTVQPPPGKSAFSYYLNQTQFGQQLLALLSAASVGGWTKGGLPERLPFRRVFGGFGPPFTW